MGSHCDSVRRTQASSGESGSQCSASPSPLPPCPSDSWPTHLSSPQSLASMLWISLTPRGGTVSLGGPHIGANSKEGRKEEEKVDVKSSQGELPLPVMLSPGNH